MIIQNRLCNLLAALCVSAGFAFSSGALAQEAEAPATPETQAPAVSDQKLESFVVAFAEVERVKQQYTRQLQNASSEQEQKTIRNEAGQQMLEVVETTDGIAVDEYNRIIQAAQSDPALAERLTKMIGQARQ